MKKIVKISVVLVLITSLISCNQNNFPDYDIPIQIIPKPVSVEKLEKNYMLTEESAIYIHTKEYDVKMAANYFARTIKNNTDLEFDMVLGSKRPTDEDGMHLVILDEYDDAIGDEGYYIDIDKSIIIKANTAAGVFYGVVSVLQMMPMDVLGKKNTEKVDLIVPRCKIMDTPRFKYRGMHLDVCRHFYDKEYVKKYLDIMALHKMNTFHWHLTEDQGWRIEIKQFPKLTEISSNRKETIVEKNFDPYIGDGEPHGGYYTQEDIKEIVQYAKERFITVIPEIELPGHSQAALAAYPELSCTGGPFEVSTTWGVKHDVYCAGNDSVFTFLAAILDEVIELFPSDYIHIGGDEVPKTRWEKCPKCQARIKEEGLADEHELQSYFIKRIEKYLNSRGKNLIGWDEILEGGLAPNATVMSWRGIKGGIEAAKQGHDVIMTPGTHMYFDHYQAPRNMEPLAIGGYTSLEKVYSFEPVPEELSEEEAKHILGPQANLWTEYISTYEYLEYMYLPRMSALAEVGWTPAELKDWNDFTLRMNAQFKKYMIMGYNYRLPHAQGLGDTLRITPKDTVMASIYLQGAEIRYTIDGTEPDSSSQVLSEPLFFNENATLKTIVFWAGKASSILKTEIIVN